MTNPCSFYLKDHCQTVLLDDKLHISARGITEALNSQLKYQYTVISSLVQTNLRLYYLHDLKAYTLFILD